MLRICYIGYCADEQKRFEKRKNNKITEIYPLVDYDIKENDINLSEIFPNSHIIKIKNLERLFRRYNVFDKKLLEDREGYIRIPKEKLYLSKRICHLCG